MAVTKHEEDANAAPRKTLFVRNLSFDTTNKQLEDAFSDFGPIKQAFIVKDKDNASKCRGFGYVQFVLQDDADTAFQSSKSMNGRKLKLCYASKKPKHSKRKEAKEEAEAEEQENTEPNNLVKQEISITETNKSNVKSDLQRTLVLTGLTSKVKRKAFRLLCEKFGEIENIVYPVPERADVTAFVRFKDYKSVIRAVQKIPGQKVKKSNTLSAVLLTKEDKFPSKKLLNLSRLIVRNLDFKCEENDLREVFSKYGKVLEIRIPTKTVNRKTVKIGCAFVQFENQKHAKLAIDGMNLKEINGRAVVIDWAVSKENYEAEKSTVTGKDKKKEAHKELDKKKCKTSDEPEQLNIKEEDGNENDGNSEGDDGNDGDNGNDGDDERIKIKKEEDEDDMEECESDDVEDDESLDEEESNEISSNTKKQQKQLKDAKEEKTVFIRNLSYNTEEDEIIETFEKYGEIEFCKVVRDTESGRSKGSAFVKFLEKNFALTCVGEFNSKENESKPCFIDGRQVIVSLAVTRGKMSEIMQQKSEVKKETDKRNLYLAYEGVILKNSPAFESLSETDRKRREKAVAEKKTKLKNPNYFVSRTRLCIRNLPLNADANELRKILVKHGSHGMKINEIKIMRNKERKDMNGLPRSLGYGFVDVSNHEDALMLLRAINNNPDVFGEKRRLIVEFSVENSKAIKLLEQRKEKNEKRLSKFQENTDESSPKDQKERNDRRKLWWEKKVKGYQKKRVQKREQKTKLNCNEGEKISSSPPQQKDNIETKVRVVKSDNISEEKSVGGFERSGRKKLKRKASMSEVVEGGKKRARKVQQDKTEKDEKKFHDLVSQYKQKLFSSEKENNATKSERWFE